MEDKISETKQKLEERLSLMEVQIKNIRNSINIIDIEGNEEIIANKKKCQKNADEVDKEEFRIFEK